MKATHRKLYECKGCGDQVAVDVTLNDRGETHTVEAAFRVRGPLRECGSLVEGGMVLQSVTRIGEGR